MRRWLIFFVTTTTIAVALAVPLWAVRVEVEDLALPTMAPLWIEPSTPTVVSVTALLPDEDLRRRRVEYRFEGRRGVRWKRAGRLHDDGRLGDAVEGDGIYTLQIELSDADGIATFNQIGKRRKHSVPSPVSLRVSAKRRGRIGREVSPPVFVGAAIRSSVPESPLSVAHPPTFRGPDELRAGSATFGASPQFGFSIDVEDENTPAPDISSWADSQTWPFGDWRSEFESVSIAGLDALHDPVVGRYYVLVGSTVYQIENGLGREDKTLIDAETFSAILNSLAVVP